MPYRKEFVTPKSEVSLWTKVVIALAAVVAIIGCVACFCSYSEDQFYAYHSTAPFVIDETDEWAMHEQELPTKGDVMNWHMSGYWGFHYYNEAGEEIEKGWYELPGGSELWDRLYGIDSNNPAFIRR